MPIGSTLDVVIQQDDLVVLGPPSIIDVAVDIGPRGEAGTQLYTGAFNPNDLTFQQFQDIYGDIPRLRDLFLRTDEGPEYGSFYQFTNVPGSDQWEIVVDLIDAVELFFDLNTDFVLQPKSGGTGINNGTSTITVGGNFRTLGSFPLDFGLSGSTVLALPTSGSVAVLQDKLNKFAPTTSAEFASVITNETGTGQVVFNTSPNITTSLTTNSTSFNLINSDATTVNLAGAGTNITMGAAGAGTLNLRNATVDMTGDLIVRGSDIIAAEATFNLIDTVATTVNFARAATTLNIGQTSGNTNVRNNLNVSGDIAVNNLYAIGVVSASGGITGELTGNAETASKLQNPVDIALGGDLSGFVSFDGSASVIINATIEPDSVALGTDTTGNYVEDATASTGIDITGSGEGANLIITNTGVISLAATAGETTVSASSGSITIGLSSDVNITNDLTVGGNLTVSGSVTYIDTEHLLIKDNIFTLNSGVTGTPTLDAGMEVNRGDEPTVAILWNETIDKWQFTNDGTNYLDLGSGSGTGEGGFAESFLTMGA